MELTVNAMIYFFLLCFIDLDLRNFNSKGRSVAALEASHVIASVRTNKELSCIVQESNPPQIVSWYRTTNVDARKCPNNTYFLNNNNDVFCDRLSNNRILQPGFEQRFSVPAMRSKNQNGLLITMVELSDAGIYACVDHNTSKVRQRINLTIDEDSSSASESSSLSGKTSSLKTSIQDNEAPYFATSSASQTVGASNSSSGVNVGISMSGAAIVFVIVTIAIVVFLKMRRPKKERFEVRWSQNTVSGQIPNNIIELSAPVYGEIKENGGTGETVVPVDATIYWKVVDEKTVLDRDHVNNTSIVDLVYADLDQPADVVTRLTDSEQNTMPYPIYELLQASDGDGCDVCPAAAAAAAAGRTENDGMTIYDVSVQDQSSHTTSTIPICTDVYATSIIETIANCRKDDDVKKTTANSDLCANFQVLQPRSPNVGKDGTVYLELKKFNGSDVEPSMQQPKQPLFHKSIYAMINHNEEPPPPAPPSIPHRSYDSPR